MVAHEGQIEALLQDRSRAMRDKDIERVMALYTEDVVYFDLVPPLQYRGAVALRARFTDWFGRWAGPIGQDLSALEVEAGEALGSAWMLIRAHGTLKAGQKVDYWVRVSNSLRRVGNDWRITHEHVSLPVDMRTRTAALDLTP